jgi:hypothetical protein
MFYEGNVFIEKDMIYLYSDICGRQLVSVSRRTCTGFGRKCWQDGYLILIYV